MSRETEIADLVRDLGAASFQKRTAATKRLVAMGPAALTALRRAADGDDFEVALRARHLVELFDQLLFVGLDLEIRTPKPTIHWSHPLALEFRATNRSDHAANVPFARVRHPNHANDALDRVTSLIALAEFLVVTSPDGRVLRLHVDDLGDHEHLMEAVTALADDTPTTRVSPGDTFVRTFHALNRDVVRYRTLKKGRYRLQLIYQPEWSDQKLIDAGVGRVVSNELTVTVDSAAPDCVLQGAGPAVLRLARDGHDVVATLTNHNDVPIRVNLNLTAASATPMSRVRWYVDQRGIREPYQPDGASALMHDAFSLDRIKELQPAESVTMMRLPMSAFGKLGPSDDPRGADDRTLLLSYTSVACRAWERMNGQAVPGNAPRNRTTLPERMLVTTLTSNALPVRASE